MDGPGKSRVAVVTDSTADIPRDLVAKYGIRVVPQILIMGAQTWLDGVEIDSSTFYQLLRTSEELPTTSQPSASTFLDLFGGLLELAEGVVAILVSSELSGTVNSAHAAAPDLAGQPLEIIDSRAASMMLGFIVLEAARAAAAGQDLQQVAQVARAMVDKVRVYFVVDTLEYLHRGGRIGAASRLVGSALNLKPVLEIREGVVTPVTRVRSRRKALDKVCELLQEQLRPGDGVHMAVLHVASPEEAIRFREQLKERLQPTEILQTECGPVIGAHAGPGTIGVAYYVE